MLIVGLTGSIATGKSTVSNILQTQCDIPVIDADKFALYALRPGSSALKRVRDTFGESLINSDGSLDRQKLGKHVFAHEEHVKKLNAIVHPVVRREVFKAVLYYYLLGYRMVILDVPLLFESRLDRFCGKTICVGCTNETQLARLKARDGHKYNEEDIKNIISRHMPQEIKLNRADIVIWNESTEADLVEKVNNVVKQLQPSYLWTYIVLLFPFTLILCISFHTIKFYSNFILNKLQNR